MENKSAIWIFTVMLVLACVYQLSFNFFSSQFEKKAAAYAVDYVNDEDSTNSRSEAEKTVLSNQVSRKYLIDSAGAQAYPLFGHTYREVKEQELNLGLDLQGGMSVTLEVSVPELVENLSGNSRIDAFKKTMADARKAQESSNDDFITLFANEWDKNKPAGETDKLVKIFKNREYSEKFKDGSNDDEIIEILRAEAETAVVNTESILRQRIDAFGVAQPNIQRLSSTGRILIELPGVDNPDRVLKLIGGTANLEFWPLYMAVDRIGAEKKQIVEYFLELDSTVAVAKDPKIFEKEAITIDSTIVMDLVTNEPLKTVNGEDSMTFEVNQNEDLIKAQRTIGYYSNNYGVINGQLRNGPVIFEVSESNMSKVDEILNYEDGRGNTYLSKIFPRDIFFMWSAKPLGQSETGLNIYALYAVKDVKGKRKADLDGDNITDALQSFDEFGNPEVSMTMNSEGAGIWGKMTTDAFENGTNVAVTMDGKVYTAPGVSNGPILTGRSSISMGGTYAEQMEEATDLANLLEAGSLPAPAVVVSSDIVGPSLGAENINNGMWSFIIALLIIMAYMIFYYSRAGLVSDFALILNIFLLIGGLAAIHATLTLPGIAGLVLTLGMAVDANVLIYERIREEMRKGKGLKVALTEGYQKAYSAIFDANITTLLTAIVLFVFGSGAIKGFATTLIIGIFTSLFSAIVITRLIFWNRMEKKKDISFSTSTTEKWFTNMNYKFVDNRKKFYVISGIIVLLGLGALFTKGLNYGVEFKGGREYTYQFENSVNTDDIRSTMIDAFKGSSMQVKDLGTANDKIRLTTDHLSEDNAEGDEKTKALINSTLSGMGLENFDDVESRAVDSAISDDFRRDARNATIIALLIIFFYIFFRFRKWQYGLGALLAMVHDVIIVLSIYSIGAMFLPFTLEVDQAFIAAILTVIGYSINDTVVVFDRIREYLGIYKKDDEKTVINKALNSTLSRTVNTSLSTFVVLLAIFILGSDSIKGFTFALMVGVVVGTYSSLFIATPSVIDLSKSARGE